MQQIDLRRKRPAGLIEMNVDTTIVGSSNDPVLFGPSFWFTLHNGAVSYPDNPSKYVRDGMKQLIINLPLLIPCKSPCREHFYDYIRRRHSSIDDVVASRRQLFPFFVDMHNYVNARYGKAIVTLDDAKAVYGYTNGKTTMRITYSS